MERLIFGLMFAILYFGLFFVWGTVTQNSDRREDHALRKFPSELEEERDYGSEHKYQKKVQQTIFSQ